MLRDAIRVVSRLNGEQITSYFSPTNLRLRMDGRTLFIGDSAGPLYTRCQVSVIEICSVEMKGHWENRPVPAADAEMSPVPQGV